VLRALARSRARIAVLTGLGLVVVAGAVRLFSPTVQAPGLELRGGPAPRAAHPNVVLIVIDTLRADFVGAWGHPAQASPELDALAAAGLRVQTVVAPTTWTRPSVAAIVTGQHPRSLGIYSEDGDVLPESAVTLAERLRGAGYTTIGATANPNLNPYYGFDQGFDAYAGTRELFDWMPVEAVEGDPAEAARRQRRGRELPAARAVLDGLLAEIDAHPTGPWYLQADLMEVHEFAADSLVLPPDLEGAYADAPTRAQRRYLRALSAVSRELDRFLRALLARPGWADTLVVVTSDHGETLDPSEHPALAEPRWHGHLVYESQALVPLILYNPLDPELVGVHTQPVGLVDLTPTVLDYVGLEPTPGRDGASIWSAAALASPYVVETQFRGVDKIALYGPRWRYIVNRDGHEGAPPRELQASGGAEDGARTSRLTDDPGEAERMAAELATWEARHPPTPPSTAGTPVPESIQSQLQALGYVE